MTEWKENEAVSETIDTGTGIQITIPGKISNTALRFTGRVKLYREENSAAVFLEGRQKPLEPFFGAQEYLDKKEGVSYPVSLTGAGKMTAVYQHKAWWLRPAFPQKWEEVPDRTQLLLVEGETGCLAIVAVCGKEYRTDICGGREGLLARAASNCMGKNDIRDISLSMAWGKDPYQCCEAAVKLALTCTGRESMYRKNRTYPAMFEKFGWCSWDAFYHKVSEKGILEKLEELKEKGVPVRWALIDDGWLDADYEKQVLKGLDAAKEKFPEGLGSCVRRMKEEYGLDQVGVWHAVMGYWNGLEEGSRAQKLLETGTKTLPDGRIAVAPDVNKAFSFYHIWHGYLKNHCGIDFVKVDGQSAVSLFYEGLSPYGVAGEAIQTGLNASAALHFENRIINCMGMASEDMWNRPSSAISRSSDDFVPDVPHGFSEHAVQNGYNSLLQGQFFWGDWDMFWSSHAENWQNAVLRAVSGGPVYTSDKVGKTDPALIWPLLKRDGTVIRCEETGVPTRDCLFENPVESKKPFKLYNRYKDCYVMAVFNIDKEQEACSGRIGTTDIPACEGKEWYLYSFREQRVARLSGKEEYSFTMKANDARLYLLLPAEDFCPVGILEKFIAPGCVKAVEQEGEKTVVLLEEAGTFGFISSRRPQSVTVGGTAAALSVTPCTRGGQPVYWCKADCGKTQKDAYLTEIFW